MTMDELAVMDGSKCIVQVRGVRPFLSDKYDLTQHPNYKMTADYDKRNYFDVVKFLSHNLILKADDEYDVIDMAASKSSYHSAGKLDSRSFFNTPNWEICVHSWDHCRETST